MAHTESAVGESAADRYDLYVRPLIADVISYLLQAPEDGEVRDRVGEDDLPGEGEAGGDTGHVLLGDADIQKTLGEFLHERLDDAESKIADQQIDTVVLGSQNHYPAKKCPPHLFPPQFGESDPPLFGIGAAVVPQNPVFHETD